MSGIKSTLSSSSRYKSEPLVRKLMILPGVPVYFRVALSSTLTEISHSGL